MRWSLVLAGIIAAGWILVSGCSSSSADAPTATVPASTATKAVATPTVPQPTKQAPAVTPTTPAGSFIRIDSPKEGATVGPVFEVTGEARIFEAQFSVVLKDANGKQWSNVHVTASRGAPDVGQWTARVECFSGDVSCPPGVYTVEAVALSAKGDGSIDASDKVKVTVKP